MVSAVYCDDPVVVIDNRTLYFGEKQAIVTGRPPSPIGGSRVRRTGPAATVVTWGAITHQVLEAADRLAAQSTPVTVIETPWLNPFDTEAVVGIGRPQRAGSSRSSTRRTPRPVSAPRWSPGSRKQARCALAG